MNINHENSEFNDLFKFKGRKEEYDHDAYMLMSGFLSEIELIQKRQRLSRKDLAEKIKVSAPYLTQVFRNNKPLNFYTLAKIKKALNIRFAIKAIDLNESFSGLATTFNPISNYEMKDLVDYNTAIVSNYQTDLEELISL